MSNLSRQKRSQIINLYRQGYSINYIARIVGCHYDTAKKWAERGNPANISPPSIARKRRTMATPEQLEQIKIILQDNPHAGANKLLPLVRQKTNLNISKATLKRYSRSFGFRWGKPLVKPLLTARQKTKRLLFARSHRNIDWTYWIFSDEKTFQLSPAPIGVRYIPGQRPIVRRSAYSGKVNVWWAISLSKRFEPEIFFHNLDKNGYIYILSRHLPQGNRRPWKFMQDNAPMHTAKLTKEWLTANLKDWEKEWPPNSPDLNPIENIWAMVSQYVYQEPINNVAELEERVREGIDSISDQAIQNVILSMNTRLSQVVRNKGDVTKY
jgi:transposase